MLNILRRCKKVRVCSGASCRAWDSEEIAKELYDDQKLFGRRRKFQVCRVSCLQRCGGGVSVQIPSSGTVIKIRKPEETVRSVA